MPEATTHQILLPANLAETKELYNRAYNLGYVAGKRKRRPIHFLPKELVRFQQKVFAIQSPDGRFWDYLLLPVKMDFQAEYSKWKTWLRETHLPSRMNGSDSAQWTLCDWLMVRGGIIAPEIAMTVVYSDPDVEGIAGIQSTRGNAEKAALEIIDELKAVCR